MGKAEITIFIVIANLVLLVFISAAVIFIFQFRKRKLMHEQEKEKMFEEHTQQLLTAQLEIQEQTMQYIGREIHDNVGQKLTLAALYTQQLEYSNRYPGIREQLLAIGIIINESLAELRALSKNLTNTYLQKTPLLELIKTECDKINTLGNCRASLTCEEAIIPAPVAVKTIVLRVLQEFFQNSLKHSGCTLVTIQLLQRKDGLLIVATDNGNGFDMENGMIEMNGIGLANMKMRAALINAAFSMESIPGRGTSMQLFIDKEKLTA